LATYRYLCSAKGRKHPVAPKFLQQMKKIIEMIKRWALPISMVMGVVAYFVFVALPFRQEVYVAANRAIAVIQPTLLFLMLFFSFCRIRPSELRLCRWHLPLLLIQTVLFLSLALLIILRPAIPGRVVYESAMLCLICPTATAAAVIVRKLGGNAAHLVTYTVMINLAVSILVPLLAPLIHPQEGLGFVRAFTTILSKVFPLLMCPMLLAWLIRYTMPRLNERLQSTGDLPFYLWTVSLALAIAVSTRSIVHSTVGFWHLTAIALVSLACCLLQFWAGRRIGRSTTLRSRSQAAKITEGSTPGNDDDAQLIKVKDNDTPCDNCDAQIGQVEAITAGQSLGQKNTVFLIWLSYTFFTPVTAIAGGFYCIWHNVINSIQLNKQNSNRRTP